MTYALKPIPAGALTIALTLLSQPVLADGVPAGTLIENTASATYSDDGGAPQTVDSNTVTVLVGEVLDVTVTTQDGSAISISSGSAVLTFEVTNTGNGPESFNLTADPAVAGNEFDVSIEAIAYDANGNGVYDPGVDIILAEGAGTPELAADEALTIFVLVSSPSEISDTQRSQVRLLADATTGTGTPGTMFAGQGVDGSDAVTGLTGADADDLGSLVASIANLNLTKSATVTDPFGGSEPVPGATITYSITAAVTGSGQIADLQVTDAIPPNTTYSPESIALGAVAQTDADDADFGNFNGSAISVAIGDADAGSTFTITFDVIID